MLTYWIPMNPSPSAEIAAHLQHNDISLAVRRMLDLTLDIGNEQLIKEAINWSKNFHTSHNEGKQPGEDFYDRANIC